ncbi:MDR family MFS transporter [Nakamurella endophytica]|uniref:MFS transporter n=1 Tax=Nakamurella endophytica TaxID=1748367 RepID=A0A917SZF1_9ACTN|nr:MDR family MFS transporter [Nakamurella endophytica]GGM04827.1 MFS transporter [Nakamurella endophytica]
MSSTSTTAPPDASSGVSLTHAQIRTILFGLMAGMFLAALDQTIVSTSIRTIADDLHGLEIQAWVTTAYLITSTVTTPLYGKLSDIYGRRPLFITAISIFVVGSFACSFSTSMYELAAFRAFQGLGAGGLFSLALAILADIVPPRERAKYQGYFLAVFGTSSVLGPVVGGSLAGADTILWLAGWRWVFLVNVPIGIIALAVVMKVLHIPHVRRDHRIDWWGAVALIVGLVPLLIVAEQGQEWGWGSARVLGLIALGVVGLIAFVLVEIRMKDEALIPMRLFRAGNFSLGMGANAVIGMVMFGAILVLPLYLQLVKGASPTKAGLLLLPLTLGIMSGSVVSGQLTSRTGRYKIFPVIGTALLAVMMVALQVLSADTSIWALFGFFLGIGFGLGLCMQTLLIAVQNVVPAKDIGVATSSATFFRQVGGTVGVAVFISLLFNTLADKAPAAVQAASGNPAFQAAAAKAAGSQDPGVIRQYLAGLGAQLNADSSFLQKVDPLIARPYQTGFADSTHIVFLVVAICAAIAFALVLLIKETPLRTMSALQERQMEEASLEAETLPAGQAGPGSELSAGVGAPTGAEATDREAAAAGSPVATAEHPAATAPAAVGTATPVKDAPRADGTAASPAGSPRVDGSAVDGGTGRPAASPADEVAQREGAHSLAVTDGRKVSVQELLDRFRADEDRLSRTDGAHQL